MVRIDSPGFVQYLVDHCECRSSLRDQVESELESINFLLTECLEDFSVQSEVGSVEVAEGEDFGRWSSSASSADSLDYVFMGSEHPRERNFVFYGPGEWDLCRFSLFLHSSNLILPNGLVRRSVGCS